MKELLSLWRVCLLRGDLQDVVLFGCTNVVKPQNNPVKSERNRWSWDSR